MRATHAELDAQVADARGRLVALITDLGEDDLDVPYLPTVNPVLWEACHAVYFQELWVLRRSAGEGPHWADADERFDSMTVEHEARWRLPVPDRSGVLEFLTAVRDRTLRLLRAGALDERGLYLTRYSVLHEDMHTEALTYTRQALGLDAPAFDVDRAACEAAGAASGDVEVAGATLRMGAEPGCTFCFDNEKWAHDVEVAPFSMSRCAVTEGEFAAFVEDGGYERDELWSQDARRWLRAIGARMPVYWRRARGGGLEVRHFRDWRSVDPLRAMSHVSWYEADAFARWAGRRLPTEAEWELACAGSDPRRSNLDWRGGGPVDVRACPGGDSDHGCRQMFGNVWEWTSTTFAPYPGFERDMYEDYSETSFHTRKVLRGGGWATRSRMVRPTLRNFFQPNRRDVVAGLRTCARSDP
ncbi:MAG: selenoneine synthase SenA [Planctomycetota bacterium]